jgi:predicted secreted Zn-dependent protease
MRTQRGGATTLIIISILLLAIVGVIIYKFTLQNSTTALTSNLIYIEKTHYYKVTGNNESAIKNSLQSHIQNCLDGTQGYGCANWKVTWTYGTKYEQDETCSISNLQVNFSVDYIFPQWESSKDSPKDLVDRWAKFNKALINQETAQKNIDLKYADELYSKLWELKRFKSCGELNTTINSVASNFISRMRKADNALEKTQNVVC